MSDLKYNIGDKIQLNKVENLTFGDHISLKLNKNYRIIKKDRDDRCGIAYCIAFNNINKERTTWWVGERDIKPAIRQLTFIFKE
jgi:hypothetical protein